MVLATVIRANFAALAILAFTRLAVAQDSPAAATAPAPDAADQKLKSVVITLDFNHATLDEAANFLRVESKRMDPDHKGFDFVLSPDAVSSAQSATLELDKVTFEQALQTVCAVSNVKYKFEGRVINILALAENPAVPAVTIPPDDKAAQATMNRLQAIVLDKVNFQSLDVAVVMQFLAAKSKELAPDHRGINFVLAPANPGNKTFRRPVSITLENVPFADVLQYIKQQTNLDYVVGDNIVTFKP